MRKVLSFFLIAVIILAGSVTSWAITPEEAGHHIGENQTVCSTVASANYASITKGQPTFLNLERPYPNQIFLSCPGK